MAGSSVSVIVNNYNYARFLREAIESALRQTHDCEVLVVDDGSTDGSQEIIATYGDKVGAILKRNGGQASAFNAGLAMSTGELVCFLDADDALLPAAMEQAVAYAAGDELSKVHWPMWITAENGTRSGETMPSGDLPAGDLKQAVIEQGPDQHVYSPTSGNIWSRAFLEQVFPIPETEYRICADAYLGELAPLYGQIGAIAEPLSLYRVHGRNNYLSLPFEEKLQSHVARYGSLAAAVAEHCRRLGINARMDRWRSNSWFLRLHESVQDILKVVAPRESFILVDMDAWGTDDTLHGRKRIPFLEHDGEFNGAPADDAQAISELERVRQLEPTHIVFAWPAFWWLDHYAGFHEHLRSRYPCVLTNDRLTTFKL